MIFVSMHKSNETHIIIECERTILQTRYIFSSICLLKEIASERLVLRTIHTKDMCVCKSQLISDYGTNAVYIDSLTQDSRNKMHKLHDQLVA